jgi:hypothetical protein
MNLHFAHKLYWCVLYDCNYNQHLFSQLNFCNGDTLCSLRGRELSFMIHLDEFLASESESYWIKLYGYFLTCPLISMNFSLVKLFFPHFSPLTFICSSRVILCGGCLGRGSEVLCPSAKYVKYQASYRLHHWVKFTWTLSHDFWSGHICNLMSGLFDYTHTFWKFVFLFSRMVII